MNISFLRTGAALLLPLTLISAIPTSTNQGSKPDPQVLAQFGLYNNPTLQRLIDTKGQQMNKVSDRPGDYGFTIVDSPVINAFATPDGHVYFTRGIMAHFNSEAQFAGVLGHELGHITARHGQAQQRRSTAAGIGLLLGSIVAPRVMQSVGGIVQQGVGLGMLKYGRDDERESDQLGVKYSTKIGYDASQMADFFQTLQRNEQASGGGGTPGFLSSHPNSADRYATVKNLAAQAKQNAGGQQLTVGRDTYLRMIDGLPYGEDPRQGYVEGGVFYHPELKFRMPIPSGWKSQNSPTQFQMAEPNGKALVVLLPAGGNSLDEAAQGLAKAIGLQSANAQRTTISGFPAVVMQGDQAAQQGQAGARVLAHVIQDGSNYYGIVGLTTAAAFQTYSNTFSGVAQGFARLTDASKLNRTSEKIRIKTASGNQTLAQALSANGVPTNRHEELAILNGMQRTDRLSSGMLFKTVGK
ncbi:M48 family metalloprotease [Hymenobacter arizonensis]|uniref:Putative Zn-dependent protease n=1 Tax=Hymenobacter arizonensis TaxID=1227077 RepID=A0A1I5SME2_HYMAR|nr:M48 family metalloprotease [Hymenobacter arizonensis]SFP71879.1 Putative Zn-dependent protease [Hymenobacter arizonensis]